MTGEESFSGSAPGVGGAAIDASFFLVDILALMAWNSEKNGVIILCTCHVLSCGCLSCISG